MREWFYYRGASGYDRFSPYPLDCDETEEDAFGPFASLAEAKADAIVKLQNDKSELQRRINTIRKSRVADWE